VVSAKVTLKQRTVMTEKELREQVKRLYCEGFLRRPDMDTNENLVRVILVLETPEAKDPPEPGDVLSSFDWLWSGSKQ